MGLKQNLKSGITQFCRSPLVSALARHPGAERVLDRTPLRPLLYGNGWGKVHPFDRQHGTETSGFMTSADLIKGTDIEAESHPYAGSQPSILREVLATLPGLETTTFLDLGCGKGRPLFVASEFAFHDIVGVELSPQMAAIARKNAAIIATRYPSRPQVKIELCDAAKFPLPSGDLAIFLYNPFSGELIDKLIADLEVAVEAAPRQVFVLYYAPVFGASFDASPVIYAASGAHFSLRERGSRLRAGHARRDGGVAGGHRARADRARRCPNRGDHSQRARRTRSLILSRKRETVKA